MESQSARKAAAIEEVDQLRINIYNLLARILARPVDQAAIAALSGLEGDSTELGKAIGSLAAKVRQLRPEAIQEEYQDLFIGVGRGELLPYASYYLTGFLNEKPLARLRNTMRELGIARDPAVKEPEDHIAALMEMMAGLIGGAFGEPADYETQKSFFRNHIGNWAPHFFKDLENAKAADFHRPAGTIGRLMMEIEQAAFEME